MSKELHRSSGFTLLEVVVAMTIVGLGVVTLLEIFSLGFRLGARSSATTERIAYGRQAMEEILARRNLPEGTDQGSLDAERRWTLQVRPVRQETYALTLSSEWELREVTLDLFEAGRENRVEFKTLRLVRKKGP